ncbi:MAG TPA: lamin tail domain-containing protein, partial [Verrucomicrobiota bacterium]|nr:lamin tail domain-containing protein [Verrucomicrobiota bacterium]
MRYTSNCKCPAHRPLERAKGQGNDVNAIHSRSQPRLQHHPPAVLRRIKPPLPGPAIAIAIALALLCAAAPRARTADGLPAPLTPGEWTAPASAQAAPDPATTRSRQLSPSNRGTALIISEIMYHPRENSGTEVLEYVEIFNTEPVSEIIGGCRLGGGIEFAFPPRMAIPGRGFVVVARDPESLRQATGITNVVGPFAGSLPNDAGQVRLYNR